MSHSNIVPFFAQNQVISSPKPDAQLAKGESCLNFAHFSMQFCNPGDPKGAWPNGRPHLRAAPTPRRINVVVRSLQYRVSRNGGTNFQRGSTRKSPQSQAKSQGVGQKREPESCRKEFLVKKSFSTPFGCHV